MLVQARSVQVGSNPIHCICSNCRQQIITRVDYVSSHHEILHNQLEFCFFLNLGIRFICMAHVFITYSRRVNKIPFCHSVCLY